MSRAFAVLLALGAGSAAADDTAERMLARMAAAHAEREFEGTFIYIHDNRIETMRVARTMSTGGPRDTVASLTGEPREVVRGDGELRTSGNGVTTVMPSGPTLPFHEGPLGILGGGSHYALDVIGEDRVAGYPTTVVEARPADAYRYRYRLWIENGSGLMLRSALATADGTAIEQLMFTNLSLRPAAGAAQTPAAPSGPLPGGPRFTEPLPEGFRLVAIRPAQGGRRHFVYSDGLANVSLYVEPLAQGLEPITGGLRRGAINLYGHVAAGHQVVVVGDVPVNTAHRLAVTLDPASLR